MKIVELLMRETLPSKKFFSSQELASLLSVAPHELRAWESEFPQIRPRKTSSGQRIYRREDVVLFSSIKHLLKEKKLTLAGAQRVLADSDEFFLIDEPVQPVKGSEPASNTRTLETMPIIEAEKKPSPEPQFTPAIEPEHHDLLKEASLMLLAQADRDDDEFDDRRSQLYQHVAQEIDDVDVEIEAHHVGEMIKDAILEKESQDRNQGRISRREYDKAVITLLASKASLTEVLQMLDRYNEFDFWQGFKA